MGDGRMEEGTGGMGGRDGRRGREERMGGRMEEGWGREEGMEGDGSELSGGEGRLVWKENL